MSAGFDFLASSAEWVLVLAALIAIGIRYVVRRERRVRLEDITEYDYSPARKRQRINVIEAVLWAILLAVVLWRVLPVTGSGS